jgi:hypothetical protein
MDALARAERIAWGNAGTTWLDARTQAETIGASVGVT